MATKRMSRRAFIEAVGATCSNWQWSWSFINHAERFVIFGAWDRDTAGRRCRIFSENWERRRSGHRNPSYKQSRGHIRLVEEEGYALRTFPMAWSDARNDAQGNGPPKIGGFTPTLSVRRLTRIGKDWYATDLHPDDVEMRLAEELDEPQTYSEALRKQITVNAVERNPKARRACVKHHGFDCVVCGFNFERVYGDRGARYIHVHHLNPMAAAEGERQVAPVRDLVRMCPNCHATVHQVVPPLDVEALRQMLRERGASEGR